MDATLRARTAYGGANPSVAATHTPRDVEYQTLARVTRRMIEAKDRDLPQLAEALFDNVRLWNALAADAADAANALTPALRANIMDLASFSVVHAQRVLRGVATADALIDVNVAVMRGLKPSEEVAA